MLEFSESYLRKNYDKFEFFDIECADKRVREIYMRTRRCLRCPGMEKCKMHPEFWLEGESLRLTEDLKIRDSGEEEALQREQAEKERAEREEAAEMESEA
jgi:hypothetical protein